LRDAFLPFVVAVDCPSGLNCDTGELDFLAFPAHLTVTFAGPKRGHFRFPGAAACGELVVADIGIAADSPEVAGVPVELATAGMAGSLFPKRPSDGHKGTFGTALIWPGVDYRRFGAILGRTGIGGAGGIAGGGGPGRPGGAGDDPRNSGDAIAGSNVPGRP
jgi:NAD(P)H-hydrate epimerase